ncbi:hypothetical protein TSOC_007620 [Tetrabaena socialis]|uniref:Uncharacterized protein n=1 Tax=Tetrabaena socialis TaxID=47790 RepID=A0A2J8A0P3_9CHLO|nr:hypothetical protein TSOC_007620 [Tetrabaena socialis]|eukprot:PNH06058.1 hypothetical protein TSOC_007620 [Tetrabaena socialis]
MCESGQGPANCCRTRDQANRRQTDTKKLSTLPTPMDCATSGAMGTSTRMAASTATAVAVRLASSTGLTPTYVKKEDSARACGASEGATVTSQRRRSACDCGAEAVMGAAVPSSRLDWKKAVGTGISSSLGSAPACDCSSPSASTVAAAMAPASGPAADTSHSAPRPLSSEVKGVMEPKEPSVRLGMK